MRRWISLGLIAVFLTVGGVPLIPAAELCALPDGVQHAASDPGVYRVHRVQHGSAMHAPAGNCRLECGCGCHNNIDTLPHLLAPHLVALNTLPIETSATQVIALPYPDITAHPPAISTPPPRNV